MIFRVVYKLRHLVCSEEQAVSALTAFDQQVNFSSAVAAILSKQTPKKAWFAPKKPLFWQKLNNMGLSMHSFAIFTTNISSNLLIRIFGSFDLIKTGLQIKIKNIFSKNLILGHFHSNKFTKKWHFFGIKIALRLSGSARKGSYFICRQVLHVAHLCIRLNLFNHLHDKIIDNSLVKFWTKNDPKNLT